MLLVDIDASSRGMKIFAFFKFLQRTNWLKTVAFNFHYLPFRQAVRLPILVANRVRISNLMGGDIQMSNS